MPKPKTSTRKKNVSSDSVGSLDRSKKLQEFKKANGLPTWKDLQDDERKGLGAAIDEKLRRMARFSVVNQQIVQTVHGAGWDVANILHQIVSLQNNLLEYEEMLQQEGKNPLTDANYMKAREQLMKDIQFISKQKLDVAQFQHKVQHSKEKMDDDDMYQVE